MKLHIHLCVLTKQIPTSCILYAIDSRGVHGSGGSGLCPTRNWPVRDWVGRNPIRNWPVKRVRFRMSVCQQVASVSSEDETQWKTPKNGQNRQNLTRSGEDFIKANDFSLKSCRKSPDLVYLCQIWLFWSPKFAKSNWKLVGITREFAKIWCLRVGRISRVLKEGTRNRPTSVEFWSSGPMSDCQSSWNGWTRVEYGRVGRMAGWVGQP